MRLNDLLTDIPGVQSADVQLVDGEVRSVRIELEPDADEQAVGGAIREVLAAYGYRSRVAPPRGRVEPAEPPPPPSPEHSLSGQPAGRPSPEEGVREGRHRCGSARGAVDRLGDGHRDAHRDSSCGGGRGRCFGDAARVT